MPTPPSPTSTMHEEDSAGASAPDRPAEHVELVVATDDHRGPHRPHRRARPQSGAPRTRASTDVCGRRRVHHRAMSFEEVMPKVMQWSTAAEALGALGAHLTLQQSGAEAPPEVADALRGVLEAAGLDGLDELAPPQQAMRREPSRLYVHQADDLLEAPGRVGRLDVHRPCDPRRVGSRLDDGAARDQGGAPRPRRRHELPRRRHGGRACSRCRATNVWPDRERRRHRHLGPVARAGSCERRRGRPRRPHHAAQARADRGR